MTCTGLDEQVVNGTVTTVTKKVKVQRRGDVTAVQTDLFATAGKIDVYAATAIPEAEIVP